MKKFILIAGLFVSSVAFGQGTDILATGGIIARVNSKLFVPHATITAVGTPDGQIHTGNLGTVTILTPVLATGTIPGGGTFGPGGSVQITAPGYATFNGTIQSATWQLITLANGTHNYTLSVIFANNKGALVLLTDNIGRNTFNGAESVQYVSAHLN